MNILFFSRLFYPHIGGVEKHVLSLSQELIAMGHTVTVITENYGWKDHETYKGISIIRFPAGKENKIKKLRIWIWLMRNRKFINNTDIIHCHDVFFWYLPFRFLYPFKPVFITFHGYEGNSIPGTKAILMHKIAEKLCQGNICVGKFLTQWYKTKPSFITYGATETLKHKIRSSHLVSHFLYIGRLEEEAGILEYIKALGILKKKGISSKLIVLGDGSQRQQAESLAKQYGLHVSWKGFVKDIETYFPSVDYVFVSRYLGILESFAHKKFVFAVYNSKIKKDYLSLTPFHTWIAISPDAEQLAQAIMEKKSKKIAIANSYAWVAQQTWQKLAQQYIHLWKGAYA